jgi:hypothetical protein
MRRVQVIFDFETHTARKILSATAHDQMVIGLFHHGFRNFRGRADSFDRGDGAGLFPRAMHARRIELDHAFRIRQTTVTHAVVERVFFDNVHAGDYRVQHVVATRNHRESFLHAGKIAAVLEFVSVG